jgi:TDG/mug DNA glycosylase family protein
VLLRFFGGVEVAGKSDGEVKRIPGWFKPTQRDFAEAHKRKVKDIIAPGLKVLFVGINPGIYTAAIRRHFGRPGNRFWGALHNGGFTPRILSPFENMELLKLGFGITNIVQRPTVRADELSDDELIKGGRILENKVKRYRPAIVAFLGVTSYRVAFARPKAAMGEQANHRIGASRVWVLPNPSGLNAHFTPGKLGEVFSALYRAAHGGS